MPGYVEMQACYSHRLSAGNVARLIVDEDNFVGGERQQVKRQCVRARVRLENFRTSGIDDRIHLIRERHGLEPVFAVKQFQLVC